MRRKPALRRLLLVLGVIAVIGLLLAVWGFLIEPRRLVINRATLSLPRWESAGETPLRVAVLTDLHVGSPHHGIERLREIVRRTNQERPDIVVLLGDLVIQGVVGGNFVEPEPIAAELRSLEAPLGRYAVLGNHDWWLDADRIASALTSVGFVMLEDTAAPVVTRGGSVWIAGVSDLWEGAHDIERALASIPPGAASLVITHNPDIFPDVPASVGLTIAGHTHGGQVRLPLIGRPVVPSSYGQKYAAGHIVVAGRHLFVGTGTGTSILPVRFRVPPEVVILTLAAE